MTEPLSRAAFTIGAAVTVCYLLLAAEAQQSVAPSKKASGGKGTKSTAQKSTASKSTVPTVPDIERDAKKALARQWMDPHGTPAHWEMCLSALDLATQAQPKLNDALTVLGFGYDGKSSPKEPYAAPAEEADIFWDWVAGAAGDGVQADPKPVNETVNSYYESDNRGLMDKVYANFLAKNFRRAVFELMAYVAPQVREAEGKAVEAQKTADDAKAMADAMAKENARAKTFHDGFTATLNSQLDPIGKAILSSAQKSAYLKKALLDYIPPIKKAAPGNAAVDSAADQLAQKVSDIADQIASGAKSLGADSQAAKKALQDAVDDYAKKISDAATAAQTDTDAKQNAAKTASDEVDDALEKLEVIRACYASVKPPDATTDIPCRTAMIQYVSGKFHAKTK